MKQLRPFLLTPQTRLLLLWVSVVGIDGMSAPNNQARPSDHCMATSTNARTAACKEGLGKTVSTKPAERQPAAVHTWLRNKEELPKEICQRLYNQWTKPKVFTFATGSEGKRKQFRNIFKQLKRNVTFRDADFIEIDAQHEAVIIHKASQFGGQDHVIVEDSALDIGRLAEVGVNVKWLISQLPNHIGKKANYRSMVGVRIKDAIFIARGEISGSIVHPRGKPHPGFDFDPYFLPMGSTKTLAELAGGGALSTSSHARKEPREIALENLLNHSYVGCFKVMRQWAGALQPTKPIPTSNEQ